MCMMPTAKFCCEHECPLTLGSVGLWPLLICCCMKLRRPADRQLPCTAAVRMAEARKRSGRGHGCMCRRLAMAWGSRCSEARFISGWSSPACWGHLICPERGFEACMQHSSPGSTSDPAILLQPATRWCRCPHAGPAPASPALHCPRLVPGLLSLTCCNRHRR